VQRGASDALNPDAAVGFYAAVKHAAHLFHGVMDTTMSHSEGWHFGRVGRLLERADKTSRILDVKYFILLPRVDYVGTPYDSLHWAALLKSASALEMYRQRHHRLVPETVASFLILDREFPRAIRYCLGRAETSLHEITGSAHGTYANAAEQHLGRLRAELDFTSIDEIVAVGMHEYLDNLQARLNTVGEAIFRTFFDVNPTPNPRAMAEA